MSKYLPVFTENIDLSGLIERRRRRHSSFRLRTKNMLIYIQGAFCSTKQVEEVIKA